MDMSANGEGCVKGNTFKRITQSNTLQLHHLPDDVLRRILSLLNFRDSCRIGILSHKWRWLWRRCCSKAVFTRGTMFRSGNANIRHTRTNFARRVNSFLRQLHSPTTMNKFVVKFGMHRKHTHDIERWVGFCVAVRARHVTFDLTPRANSICFGEANSKYVFPLHIFSGPDGSYAAYIKSLHLGNVCLNTNTPGLMGFNNLKKLTLHKISFLGDLQCLVLPDCNALEWLSISCSSLPTLTTSQPLQRLLYLRLHYCNMEKIELEAPNLTSFDFTNQPILFSLGGSLKVGEASIKMLHKSTPYGDNLDYIYTELPATLRHVQKLTITLKLSIFDELQGFAKTSARFINLRHLTLYLHLYGENRSVGGILRLAYLLELAPSLEELELHVNGDDVSTGWALRGNMVSYPHYRLKRVLISGACLWEGLMELAYYIFRSARKLESMIIDPMMRTEGHPPEGWMLDVGRKMIKKPFDGGVSRHPYYPVKEGRPGHVLSLS